MLPRKILHEQMSLGELPTVKEEQGKLPLVKILSKPTSVSLGWVVLELGFWKYYEFILRIIFYFHS